MTNSHYLLYLQQFPLELTLELQSDGKNVCAPGPYIKDDDSGQNLSTSFDISDVEATADLLILDSGIVESINKALAGGTGLNMPLRNWSQATFPISATGGALSEHHAGVLQTQGRVHHLPPYLGQGCGGGAVDGVQPVHVPPWWWEYGPVHCINLQL